MEQVLYGVRGIVTDAANNAPLKAKLFINSHDIDESHVYSSVPVGNYNRLLKGGIYSFTFSALGYDDTTFSMINAGDYQTTVLYVSMDLSVGTPETKELDISIHPNPATDFVNLKLPDTGKFDVNIIDGNGKIIRQINSIKGNINISLTDYSAGTYNIMISNGKGELFSKKLILK